MDDRVERIAREPALRRDVVQERGRVGRQLEQVVQALRAGAHPQVDPELAHARARQPIAAGQPHVAGVDPQAQLAHPLAVGRIALVVAAIALEHALVGGPVDVIDRAAERGQATGQERLAQTLRGDREVRGDAEPAKALAEHAPAIDAELRPDPLGVAHDGVGAEVRQVVRLLLRRAPGQLPDRGGAAGAALVEHEHAELLQGAVEPRRRGRPPRRPRRLRARPALEVDEERPVAPVGVGHLARKHGDPLAARRGMVEGHRELVLGQHEAGGADVDGHDAIMPQRGGNDRSRPPVSSATRGQSFTRRGACGVRTPGRTGRWMNNATKARNP